MTKLIFRLVHPQARKNAIAAIERAPDGQIVTIEEAKRTNDQNAKLWPMLSDLSKQVIWHGVKLSQEDWKNFATATLEAQRMIPNLDGDGFIALGVKTSTMSKKRFSDLLEIVYMIGARNDVKWSDEASRVFTEHCTDVQNT